MSLDNMYNSYLQQKYGSQIIHELRGLSEQQLNSRLTELFDIDYHSVQAQSNGCINTIVSTVSILLL